MKKAGKGRLSELDIIFSIVLGIFCIYLFFLVGAESPAPTATELECDILAENHSRPSYIINNREYSKFSQEAEGQ